MLGVNQLDFLNYTVALKGNYRKGVYKFRTILDNPSHAAEFATNLGGVSVVLGVPIDAPDRNSDQLLALLQASSVIDTATLTWLSQWYKDYADDWDTLAADITRCTEIVGNALMWRAASYGSVSVGKIIATLAGLSCASYADMDAVAASSTAMAAVAASSTAMAAVIASPTALAAVVASQTAMAAVIASPTALAAVVASSTAMTAVAASQTAMTAVATSPTARNALYNSSTAKAALDSSPLKTTVRAAYSTQSNNKYTNLNKRAFILKATGSGSGTWTFFDVYNPPSASSTTSIAMGSGNAFNLYLVGTAIVTQHGGGSTSDYIDIQYIPC